MFVSTAVYAQAPPPSSNNDAIPIDGLVTLLLAAGAGYGAFRFKNLK